MALLKSITQEDGVITNYHRISRLESVINSHVSIVVFSYVDQDSRQSESAETRPYKSAVTYETDYVENMTIESAYNYLKSLPEFEGAEDI